MGLNNLQTDDFLVLDPAIWLSADYEYFSGHESRAITLALAHIYGSTGIQLSSIFQSAFE